jgi:hypothetical protein
MHYICIALGAAFSSGYVARFARLPDAQINKRSGRNESVKPPKGALVPLRVCRYYSLVLMCGLRLYVGESSHQFRLKAIQQSARPA